MLLTRRHFLHSAAASGATLGFHGFAAEPKRAASDKLNLAVVGLTNRGGGNLNGVAPLANIVALCDVDDNRAGPVRQRFPKAVFHADWRKLLDVKGLDAVVISTPDHTHAPITAAALRAGLHVYCEKPLTHTVHEARTIANLAKKHNRVTQMGTQIHAEANYRRVVEIIQAGVIGPVREVHTWCGRSYWGGDPPTGSEDVPRGLHWDLWLGPAPARPFVHGKSDSHGWGVYHPFNWRTWWDFGGGTLNDMACHHVDLPFWALKLRHPIKVTAEGPPPHKHSSALWQIVRYEFAARGELPAVALTWYDGGKRPPLLAAEGMPKWGDGNLFVGDKGMLLADYGRYKLLPEKSFADFVPPKKTIADSVGHHKEWLDAIVASGGEGGTTTCNFDYAGALTECVLLGTVSYRSGKSFRWDAEKFTTSEPAANAFLHKEYRKGWTL